jgi:hypothetical protein
MQLGQTRFNFYVVKLEELLLQASRTDNAALYLYQNNTRTIAFMLEGLCKLYAGMHNQKKFEKLKDRFKELEDMLGAIDYYDAFSISFKKDKTITDVLKKYITARKEECIATLNTTLEKKKWISHDPSRLTKINKKLSKLKWKTPEEEIILIKSFYEKSIDEINDFFESTGDTFTNLEDQVHEIRRKIRWLSIYPQALQGVVQFSRKVAVDKNVKKYLTKETVNSPFNVFPKRGVNKNVLLVHKNYFLAMSNVIATLGKIKDKGLKIVVLAEAIKNTQKSDEAMAMKKALAICKMKPNGVQLILQEARSICNNYFSENNLGKLLA